MHDNGLFFKSVQKHICALFSGSSWAVVEDRKNETKDI